MNNNVTIKTNSFGKNFLKGYLICIVVGVVLFFVCAIIKFALAVNNDAPIDTDLNSIIVFIQYTLPIMSILFGWIPGLGYASANDRRK